MYANGNRAGRSGVPWARLSERTRFDYTNYIKRWVRAGEPDPIAWVDSLSPASARIARSALKQHFRITKGIELDIPYIQQVENIPEALTDVEWAVVRKAAHALRPRFGHTCDFLYGTGLRLGEAVEVVPKLDLHGGKVLVRRPKGGLRQREVPINGATQAAIDALLAMPHEYHPDRLLGLSDVTIRKQFVRLSAGVGFRVFAHKLRHTFATTLLARGADIITVQRLMGHATLSMTMRYLHTTDARQVQAVALLG